MRRPLEVTGASGAYPVFKKMKASAAVSKDVWMLGIGRRPPYGPVRDCAAA